ncbi:MAG: hypothetical protein AB1750_15345 [Chloroflexota bacterium]
MYPAGDMSNPLFNNIPPIWFVRRREYLETSYQEITALSKKISRLSNGNNAARILDAADLLLELNSQIDLIVNTFHTYTSSAARDYDPYNSYELQRIKELSTSTANHLNALARQVSWGAPSEKIVSQVQRNLNPLINLIQKTLIWIDQSAN